MNAPTPHDHAESAPGRLEQIEARLAAAVRLPWMKDPDDPDKVLHSTKGGYDGYVIATVQKDDFGLFEEGNTDLIAHAPEDLATLVAVVKAVQDLLGEGPRGGDFQIGYMQAMGDVRAAINDTLEAS